MDMQGKTRQDNLEDEEPVEGFILLDNVNLL